MRIKRPAVIIIAGITMGLAGTGYGIASAVTSNSVYHGCVETGSRILENVHTKPVTCPAGTLAVTWNQTGPQGPQGIPGPSTAGPNGLDVSPISVFGDNASLVAVCPAATPYVISGGFFGLPSGITVESSMPQSVNGSSFPNAWAVRTSNTTNFTAYAMCSK
jgi:hypothetical protein